MAGDSTFTTARQQLADFPVASAWCGGSKSDVCAAMGGVKNNRNQSLTGNFRSSCRAGGEPDFHTGASCLELGRIVPVLAGSPCGGACQYSRSIGLCPVIRVSGACTARADHDQCIYAVVIVWRSCRHSVSERGLPGQHVEVVSHRPFTASTARCIVTGRLGLVSADVDSRATG